MLAVKFRNRRKVNIKQKIEIINTIFDIIGVEERKDFFYSDYTFSKVEESKTVEWMDDLLENNIFDELNNDYFVTLIANAPYGSIRAEINPNKARKHVRNCSHIDINVEGETSLYKFLNATDIKSLRYFFDTHADIMSEFYFFDLNRSPDFYSDVDNRVCTKAYDEVEFADLLLSKHEYDTPLDKKTITAIGCNFVNQMFQTAQQPGIRAIIHNNNLDVSCAAGSFMVYGNDVPIFMGLMRDKLMEYIELIKEKDVYKTEFDKLFESKRGR